MGKKTGSGPKLYIEFYEGSERRRIGPFWSIAFDGSGLVINQDWIAYKVQTENLHFERVTVKYCHIIVSD